jgi:altronate hydrolase
MTSPIFENKIQIPAALLLMAEDDVMIACQDIQEGTEIGGPSNPFRTQNRVPSGHKVARHRISKGSAVRKFGQVIGFASENIESG